MASRPAIVARNVSKAYKLNAAPRTTTLQEAILHKMLHPLERPQVQRLDALSDVSFSVEPGEAVGVIGHNGAGKSTLLKVITRITAPTSGELVIRGRVGSLLEIGTGFHPELTGRENIYLNGSILGMRAREIERLFDQIVDFAGVERFLDTPVKRYSSGMHVRLAFAVAAHLRSDILLMDEVLAVGDAAFQEKCIRRMHDLARDGRTILFVSHNMAPLQALCPRAIVLHHGRVTYDGSSAEAAQRYFSALDSDDMTSSDSLARRGGSGELRVVRLKSTSPSFACAEPKVLDFDVECFDGLEGEYSVGFLIGDDTGTVVAHCESLPLGKLYPGNSHMKGRLTLTTPWLRPGTYWVNAVIFQPHKGMIDVAPRLGSFVVAPLLPYLRAQDTGSYSQGPVLAQFDIETIG